MGKSISIHAPTRGATEKGKNRKQASQFQSTLPREERPYNKYLSKINIIISIHAPTRGATKQNDRIRESYDNFNPRSHERSDTTNPCSFKCLPDFNPRSHERSDIPCRCYVCWQQYFNPRSHERSDTLIACVDVFLTISIHAPTRGATFVLPLILIVIINFNPRSHERSDATMGTLGQFPVLFQSTLPREERLRT